MPVDWWASLVCQAGKTRCPGGRRSQTIQARDAEWGQSNIQGQGRSSRLGQRRAQPALRTPADAVRPLHAGVVVGRHLGE